MQSATVQELKPRHITAEELTRDIARVERLEKLYIAAQSVRQAKLGLDMVKQRNVRSEQVARDAMDKAVAALDELLAAGRGLS